MKLLTMFNVYDTSQLHDQIIKNVASTLRLGQYRFLAPIFLIKNIPCNKYNINLIGSKQNKIEFTYHNIKFTKQTKGSSLAKLYKEILSVGDNVKSMLLVDFHLIQEMVSVHK